ncbi:MAG: lipase family protein [Steroidobacteraceae bacterium]
MSASSAHPRAAHLALLCWAAEQVGPVPLPHGAAVDAAKLAPPAWIADRYRLAGWITGDDRTWFSEPPRTFYGWLLEAASGYVVVLRGTESVAEWLIDADFPPRIAHHLGGEVESGFYGLYTTLALEPEPETVGLPTALIPALRAYCAGRHVTVTGHSLGAALATYATLDLAAARVQSGPAAPGGEQVTGVFIASPHPGDREFAAAFAATVKDAVDYHYQPDLVGDVPWGMGYTALECVETIPANPAIPDNPASNHHAVHYAWLLCSAALDVLPEAERAAVLAGIR